MFTSQIFSRSVVLSSAHFILSLPLFSDIHTAQPPSMSSHYQILSVLYFGLLSNPCFLSSNAAIVSQKSLCLNWKTDKSLFFFKFLQPYFLTLKNPPTTVSTSTLISQEQGNTFQNQEMSCCFDMTPYKTSEYPLHLVFSSPRVSTPIKCLCREMFLGQSQQESLKVAPSPPSPSRHGQTCSPMLS